MGITGNSSARVVPAAWGFFCGAGWLHSCIPLPDGHVFCQVDEVTDLLASFTSLSLQMQKMDNR